MDLDLYLDAEQAFAWGAVFGILITAAAAFWAIRNTIRTIKGDWLEANRSRDPMGRRR